MTNFLLSSLTTAARYSKAQFKKKTRNCEAVQEQFLQKLLLAHQNTELGQKYNFKDIDTVEAFQKKDSSSAL